MKKEKLKRAELEGIYKALKQTENLAGDSSNGAKYAYAIAKNVSKIESELKFMDKARAKSEKMEEFSKKRTEMLEKHANKDENGKPMKKNGMMPGVVEYDVFDKSGEIKKAFVTADSKLREQYKDAIEKYEKQMDDYEKMLDEEVEFEFHAIKPEYVPNTVTPAQMTGLIPMLDGEIT